MIENKDWNRMYDLIVDGKDGASVARSITKKDKAVNRYVAALRILSIDPRKRWKDDNFTGEFEAFGNRAISLGATFDDICGLWDKTPVPESLIQQTKEEISSTDYRANINTNFWKALRHNGIPVSTYKVEPKDKNYFDEGIKIVFYPNTYDQCYVCIGVKDHDYCIEEVSGLEVDKSFIGSHSYIGGYAEVFENILFDALNQTIMGGNL